MTSRWEHCFIMTAFSKCWMNSLENETRKQVGATNVKSYCGKSSQLTRLPGATAVKHWTQFRATRFATEKDRKWSFSKVSHVPHISSYSNYQCNCFKSHLNINEKGYLGSLSYGLLTHQAMQSITVYHTCTYLWIVFWFSFLLDHNFGKSIRKSC